METYPEQGEFVADSKFDIRAKTKDNGNAGKDVDQTGTYPRNKPPGNKRLKKKVSFCKGP